MLDDVKANFLAKHISLPKNARTIHGTTKKGVSEYYDNMNAPTRVLEEYGKKKEKRFVWRETRADHYAFAEGYANLAKRILVSIKR